MTAKLNHVDLSSFPSLKTRGYALMNFKYGYQAGRFVGEHYLDYLIGFQIGFWMGVPLAIMKQGHSQRRYVDRNGHRNPTSAIEHSGTAADAAQNN